MSTKHTTLDHLKMLATRTKGELDALQEYIDTITDAATDVEVDTMLDGVFGTEE